MSSSIVAVILCGGSGTRLWPESRKSLPKQFLPLIGAQSLFQSTLERAALIAPEAKPIVLTNEEMRFLVLEDAQAIGADIEIVLEPAARDTGAAIAVAALLAAARDEGSVLVIMPSDHFIAPPDLFRDDIARAVAAAQNGRITVFGIVPNAPSTAYGYVAAGDTLDDATRLRAVARFSEKPDATTATQFISEGQLWNSGLFVARAADLIDAFTAHAPDILEPARKAVKDATEDEAFLRLGMQGFTSCAKQPFDIAVMEKVSNAAILPARFSWSDIGAWDALWDISDKDVDGNAVSGDVVLHDTKDALIRTSGRLTAVLGLSNIAVITTPDAVLVAPKDRMQDVKQLVAGLEAQNRREVAEHRRMRRPWGSYETKDKGDRYRVKRITVAPGGRLSLQKHFHRSEHWVVVRGTARVTLDDTVQTLNENESTYIPIGAVHRLENPGKIPLELIEVQVGTYLEEDDIVRLEDQYGRDTNDAPVRMGQR